MTIYRDGQQDLRAASSDPTTAAGVLIVQPTTFTGSAFNRFRESSIDGATIAGRVSTTGLAFNGSTWDRLRNNHDITALASGARTATTTSASLTNYNARGMTIQLDVTAVGAPAGTITLIEVLTLVGTTEVVLYSFDIVDLGAIGTRHLLVYPGAASAASWSVAPLQGPVPRTFRIRATHLDANSITYSIVCSMIV